MALLSCFPALAAQTGLLLSPGSNITPLAGSGKDGIPVEGDARYVALASPRGLAYDPDGNLFIADSRNHQIVRVTPAGALTIFAGNGSQGYVGDGGLATSASFDSPAAVAFSSDGSLYIADTGNHCVRRIAAGVITTVAGSGRPGSDGDGGPATAARLRSPSGLAFGLDGTLYIADTGNHRIRKLTPEGLLMSVAGSGSEDDTGDGGPALAATFRSPGSLQMLSDGRLLIADRDAHRLRALLPDNTVVAYTSNALLRRPEGLGVDTAGNLLIADAGDHRIVLSGPDTSGAMSSRTSAGVGGQGVDVAGPALSSPMDSPAAAISGRDGNIAISDRRNHQVQQLALGSLTFGEIPAGRTSASQDLTLTNGSRSDLRIGAIEFPAGFVAAPHNSGCPRVPFTLRPGSKCKAAIAFSPIAQGQQSGMLSVRPEGAPASTVVLSGTATAPGSLARSITTLSSDGSLSYAGAPINLTASVSGSLSNVPVGNVTIFDSDLALTTTAITGGSATVTTTALQTGPHTLHAAYSGDAIYSASLSPELKQTVVPAPDFALSFSSSSYSTAAGGTITIPIAVVPINGTLNQITTLSVTGLPPGSASLFTPSIFKLGGAPVAVTLSVTLPTALSREASPDAAETFIYGIPCLLLPFWIRRHARSFDSSMALAILATAVSLCSSGCGGFRASTNPSTSTEPKTSYYTALVSATTTGVMGDALVHSAAIRVVVTP